MRVAKSQTKRDTSSRENLLWEKGTGKLGDWSGRRIELCGATGPARREQGDEAILLDLVFDIQEANNMVSARPIERVSSMRNRGRQ